MSDTPYSAELNEHISVMEALYEMEPIIEEAGSKLVSCLQAGGKVLLLGNGGSAADAQHISAEIVGRYKTERKGLPAIALTTDTSILTAVSNDYGFESVFSRQVEALANKGDIVIVYSTSGNSANVLKAVEAAKDKEAYVIAMAGETGGKLKAVVDLCLCVPSTNTPRIQEAHAFIGHRMCAQVDAGFVD